jgi:sulfatase modifying factor 1
VTAPFEPLPALDMVPVPGGTVDLRDDRRGTRWQVEVAPFLLGRFPVTAGLHSAVTGTAHAGSAAAPATGRVGR